MKFTPLPAVAVALFASSVVHAQTWNVDGNSTWTTDTNWSPATVPNAQDAAVVFGPVITASRTITLNQSVTVGSITFNEDAVTANSYIIAFSTNPTLTFDVSSGNAAIDARGVGGYQLGTQGNGIVQLNDNLAISAGASGASTSEGSTVAINSQVTGTGGLILSSLNSNDGTGSAPSGVRGTYLRSTVANTFTGGITVNSGYLGLAGNIGNAGTGTITLNASDSTNGGIGTGFSLKTGGGTLANDIVFGNAAATGGGNPRLAITLADTSAQNYIFSGNLSGDLGNQTVRFSTASNTVASSLTLSGNGSALTIGGSGVFQVRSGSLILGSANALGANNTVGSGGSGGWQLGNFSNNSTGSAQLLTNGYNIGGRITLNAASAAGNTSNDTIVVGGVHSSGTATFAGNVRLDRIVGGTRQFQLTSATGGTTILAGNIVDGSVSGNASTVLPLNKVGGGTVILSGTNTYAGTTTVTAGTLLINGNNVGATGAISVGAGATLGGSGTLGGSTTVTGTLMGGSGAVGTTLTSGLDITLNDNAVIALTLGAGGTHSTLARTGGAWTFDGIGVAQAFTFIDLGAEVGSYAGLITGLAADPGVASWTITNAGWSGTFSYNSGNVDLTLSAVPEPGVLVLGALGVAFVLITRRRRPAA